MSRVLTTVSRLGPRPPWLTQPEQLHEAVFSGPRITGTGFMTIHPSWVGIDVSKARLDIFDGVASSTPNSLRAIRPLARRWAARQAVVVFEATGAYDRLLARALQEAGVTYARVNPARARDFARAAGFLAKTDAVDARMLAQLGERLQPRPATPPSPARQILAGLHRRRDQLVLMRKQDRTRLKGPLDPDIAILIAEHLAWLDQAIADLDRRIAQAVKADTDLAHDSGLLTTIPGLGPTLSTVLMGLLPELGHRSPKAIAALVGLAPINRDSGQHRGRRVIGGGRKRVRDALYMAAVAASRSHSRLADTYTHLRAAGKPPKVALVALARKLLITANAVIRDQHPFAA